MTRQVPCIAFRRLLRNIRDTRPDVRIRIRILGKMWGESFCSIDFMAENQLVLHEESCDDYQYINNINDIVQFELECSFLGFHAFYHYEVQYNTELTVQNLVTTP